jgi:hypothetical protein
MNDDGGTQTISGWYVTASIEFFRTTADSFTFLISAPFKKYRTAI